MATTETTASPTHVPKVCAYITRSDGKLLVFEGPEHEGYQVPKGTVEPGERPREALFREVPEETGLGALASATHLATDVWTRRHSPHKRYVRHFYHATVYEPRDSWSHVHSNVSPRSSPSPVTTWDQLSRGS